MIYWRWIVDQMWTSFARRFRGRVDQVDKPSSTMVIFYFVCINKFRPHRQLRFLKWFRKRVNLSYKFKYRPHQVVRIEVQLDIENKVVLTLPNTWFRRTRIGITEYNLVGIFIECIQNLNFKLCIFIHVSSIQVMFPNWMGAIDFSSENVPRIEVSASSMDVRIVRYNVLLALITTSSYQPHLLIILEYGVVYIMKSLIVCV